MKKSIHNNQTVELIINNHNHTITRRRFLSNAAILTAGVAIFPSMACEAKSRQWQIGCYTRPWADYEYRVAFDGIAEAGFKYAGIMTAKGGYVITPETTPEDARKVGEEARARGLKVAALYGGNHDANKPVNEGVAQLKRLIDNSSFCGSPILMLGGISNPKLVETYYKMIAECCDYAADKGVALTIKQHGGTNTTGAECRQHIEKVGHKNFNLIFDPGNVYYYTDGALDPVIDAEDVDGLVVGMCVKDFRLPKDVNVTPGTGMVDFPKLFTRLKQGGFRRGSLIVEALSIDGDLSYINSEAKKAFQFLIGLTK